MPYKEKDKDDSKFYCCQHFFKQKCLVTRKTAKIKFVMNKLNPKNIFGRKELMNPMKW